MFFQVIIKAMNLEKDIEFKGTWGDLVTQTDKEIENILVSTLKAEFPDHK